MTARLESTAHAAITAAWGILALPTACAQAGMPARATACEGACRGLAGLLATDAEVWARAPRPWRSALARRSNGLVSPDRMEAAAAASAPDVGAAGHEPGVGS